MTRPSFAAVMPSSIFRLTRKQYTMSCQVASSGKREIESIACSLGVFITQCKLFAVSPLGLRPRRVLLLRFPQNDVVDQSGLPDKHSHRDQSRPIAKLSQR